MNTTRIWKLDSPKMCRDFLEHVRTPDGNKIEWFEQADGKRIPIADASDSQIMQVASDIAAAIEMSKRSSLDH